MTIAISSAFDSGSIEVLALEGTQADLAIRHDLAADGTRSEFLQWFHFRISGAERSGARLRIVNAGQTTYAGGWRDYRAVASWDRRRWERVPTAYDGAVMTIELAPVPGPTYVAYFEPYSWERHLALLADSCARGATLRRLGSTVQGRDLDALVVGEGGQPVWIIGRQHPGETMAEWFIEGLLARLLDEADPVGRALRRVATFHVVPNMNPDGSVLGNLRTNAAGANLNREWANPTLERSPEVLHVLAAMDESGVDFAMDVHGDEAIPQVFIAGFEGIPSMTNRQADLLADYKARLERLSPDFQTKIGYPPSAPGKANLTMSTNQVAERFGCLAMTLEMPFKDNDDLPDPVHGWSPERSKALGRDCLAALAEMIDDLR